MQPALPCRLKPLIDTRDKIAKALHLLQHEPESIYEARGLLAEAKGLLNATIRTGEILTGSLPLDCTGSGGPVAVEAECDDDLCEAHHDHGGPDDAEPADKVLRTTLGIDLAEARELVEETRWSTVDPRPVLAEAVTAVDVDADFDAEGAREAAFANFLMDEYDLPEPPPEEVVSTLLASFERMDACRRKHEARHPETIGLFG